MGKWGKNSVVAAVAVGCALLVMGVVRLDGRPSPDPAEPEAGSGPGHAETLRQPVPLPDAAAR